MERFGLKQNDFKGLHYEPHPIEVYGVMRTEHLYDISDAWRRAIDLKRIPASTPEPQVGMSCTSVTVEEALLQLPGCANIDRRFQAWLWKAIVSYYEKIDQEYFTTGMLRKEIALQVQTAVQELNEMYQPFPRSTSPLPASNSFEALKELLNGAPRLILGSLDLPEGLREHECSMTGVITTEWCKAFKLQVNDAVAQVIHEHGDAFAHAARWLVYDSVSHPFHSSMALCEMTERTRFQMALCIGSVHWYEEHKMEGRWVDDALEALEGAFKV